MRDSLGLTYDVSFELTLFDRLRVGWYVVRVTSTPAKIQDALAACIDVLRSLHSQPVAQRELVRAKRTLLTKHESDLKVLSILIVQGHIGPVCLPVPEEAHETQ